MIFNVCLYYSGVCSHSSESNLHSTASSKLTNTQPSSINSTAITNNTTQGACQGLDDIELPDFSGDNSSVVLRNSHDDTMVLINISGEGSSNSNTVNIAAAAANLTAITSNIVPKVCVISLFRLKKIMNFKTHEVLVICEVPCASYFAELMYFLCS